MPPKPKYKTAAEMQTKIDEYFDLLFRPAWKENADGVKELIYDERTGEQVLEQFRPATVTGLAHHLGMTREGISHYKGKNKAFADTIARARERVQVFTEENLYDRNKQKGAEFSLRCNFGWIPEETERALRIKERSIQLQEDKLNGMAENVDEINNGIKSLAELINSPAPNRALEDFEE